jgi:hypothetical protein
LIKAEILGEDSEESGSGESSEDADADEGMQEWCGKKFAPGLVKTRHLLLLSSKFSFAPF